MSQRGSVGARLAFRTYTRRRFFNAATDGPFGKRFYGQSDCDASDSGAHHAGVFLRVKINKVVGAAPHAYWGLKGEV